MIPKDSIKIHDLIEIVHSSSIHDHDLSILQQNDGTKKITMDTLKTYLKDYFFEALKKEFKSYILEEQIGTIKTFASLGIPHNYLFCDGRSILIKDYPLLYDQIADYHRLNRPHIPGSFYLPDLRGVFIRGLDRGRNMDTDPRGLGSYQRDSIQQFQGSFEIQSSSVGPVVSNPSGCVEIVTQKQGGRYVISENFPPRDRQIVRIRPDKQCLMSRETRPKNVALRFAIMAKL